jgi:hypothetical protein
VPARSVSSLLLPARSKLTCNHFTGFSEVLREIVDLNGVMENGVDGIEP